MPTIETPRLIVRSLEMVDVPALVAMWADGDVTRYMGGPRDREDVEMSLQAKARFGQPENFDLWPVIRKANGALVGHCGLLRKTVDGESEIELVYVIAKEAWGHGYATEAATAICDYALN